LIGYLTSGNARLSPVNILKLTVSFCIGTILVLLPLGIIASYIGKHLLFLNDSIAWAIGGVLLILMGLQFLHVYKPLIRSIFNFFKVPTSYTVTGAFLLGLSFEAIPVGREGSDAAHRTDLYRTLPDSSAGFFHDHDLCCGASP
jgi:cytochrome c biogenesis protein CcdA